MVTDEELVVLVDNKLREDFILPIIVSNNIVEIHKPDETGFYKMRVTDLSAVEFKEICKTQSFYILSDWMYIDRKSFISLVQECRPYLEDLFFDFK